MLNFTVNHHTCTRCGEYVKITREDFEHYTLSQGAVTLLDMFKPHAARVPRSPKSE